MKTNSCIACDQLRPDGEQTADRVVEYKSISYQRIDNSAYLANLIPGKRKYDILGTEIK